VSFFAYLLGMTSTIAWIFYVSELGRPVVQRELEKLKLDRYELGVLERVLIHLESQDTTWHDSTYLGREMWEARVRLINRQVRVLYSVELEERIHLALLAAVKKTQKVPRQWIDTAISRRTNWRSRMEHREGV
jgi:phage-related protein